MEDEEQVPRGIFTVPNEILLAIFDLLPTGDIIPLTPTCRQFHTLILRLLHNRLQTAASLEGQILYLECHPPSAKFTASTWFCTYLGTDGLHDLLKSIYAEESYVGQVKSVFGMYTRFRPHIKDPEFRTVWRHPARDVPGSRTYSIYSSAPTPSIAHEVISESVAVDAHDLFTQLSAFAYLGKREPTRGLLFSIQKVSEGVIRVWRDWLSKQCERKKWTDGESIVVHHDAPSSPITRTDSVTGYTDPVKDPSVLWVNGRDNNLGVRLRVKEQNWTRAPVLYSSDVEIPVSYRVEFEEVLVRTTHLMVMLEEAEKMVQDQSGKAIMFGSFRG